MTYSCAFCGRDFPVAGHGSSDDEGPPDPVLCLVHWLEAHGRIPRIAEFTR